MGATVCFSEGYGQPVEVPLRWTMGRNSTMNLELDREGAVGVPVVSWQAPADVGLSRDGTRVTWPMKQGSKFSRPSPAAVRLIGPAERSGSGVVADDLESLLGQFLGLGVNVKGRRDTQRLIRFVNKWGPLGLCQHSLPATHFGHRQRTTVSEAMQGHATPEPWGDGESGSSDELGRFLNNLDCCRPVSEPLDVWWRYVDRLSGIATVAALLHLGRPADRATWHQALGRDPQLPDPIPGGTPRSVVASVPVPTMDGPPPPVDMTAV